MPRGVKSIFFSNMVMQVTFSSYGQTGDLRVRSKGQISLKFLLPCQFQFLYQILCVFLQIKDRKHIEQNFHSVTRIMGQGWDLGCWGGVKNFSVGFWDGVPLTAHSSYH